MDNIIKTGEQDIQNLSNELESAITYLLSPLTTAFSGTEQELQKGLKQSKTQPGGMNGYVQNIIAAGDELTEGFENFLNSPEQTLNTLSNDTIKILRENTLAKQFSDQNLFKQQPLTLGGKAIITKNDVQKAHTAVLNNIKKSADDNSAVKKIVDDQSKPVQKKYSELKKHVGNTSDANKLITMGESLHFKTTFKKLFNTNNFPLLLTSLIVFFIGLYISYEYLQTSESSYTILYKNTLIGVGAAIGVISVMICIYFKYDIITGLIFATIMCTIMLMICQYTIIINYNALGKTIYTQIKPSEQNTFGGDTTTSALDGSTVSPSQLVCNPYGNFPPSCYTTASPSTIAARQKAALSSNETMQYIEQYLQNQKKIVMTYTIFIFIIIGVYIVSYLILYRYFPKYDKHVCYLISIGVGLLYIAHYITSGYEPVNNNKQSIRRFQNINEILTFLFGPNWVSIFVWMIILIFICFIILYWGARNLDITSNNVFFNSIFMIIVVLIISFSYVLFKQLRNQDQPAFGQYIEGTNVANKNILYIMIGLIALSVLLMAAITRKIYKNTNK